MMRDITIGRYYPEKSIIHKLDPRVKIVGTLCFVFSVFLFTRIEMLLVATVFLTIAVKVSRVPFRFILKGIRGLMVLLMCTMIVSVFFSAGAPIFELGFIRISEEGIRDAVLMFVRFSNVMIGTQIMTLTTTPLRLSDGMEKLLSPLRVFKLPIYNMTMIITITLRFIPILSDEADKIMKAQMARGADFESGGLIQKARNLMPLLIPLIASAFRRGDDLSMAMEARNYTGGEGRTKLHPLKYHKEDGLGYAVIILYLGLFVVLGKVL